MASLINAAAEFSVPNPVGPPFLKAQKFSCIIGTEPVGDHVN